MRIAGSASRPRIAQVYSPPRMNCSASTMSSNLSAAALAAGASCASFTLLTPRLDPSRACIHHCERRHGEPHALPHPLTAELVHAERRTQHTAAGIRETQRLERTLYHPVLAAAAVQCDEYTIEKPVGQHAQHVVARVDGVGVDAALQHGRMHRRAALERDLAFGGTAAHQHRHLAEGAGIGNLALRVHGLSFAESVAATPTMRTSGIRRTPCARSTVSTMCVIRASMSAARAVPVVMMKLACLVETQAPPIQTPFNPAVSMSRAA